ncbi:MAG TPA: molybdopterin-dependent oxidoreductase [Sphingobium sp.]
MRSICTQCSVGCGIIAHPTDVRSVKVEGDARHPANRGALCHRAEQPEGTAALDGRRLYPEIQGKRATWDRAVTYIAKRLSDIIGRHGPQAVALRISDQLLTEDYYVANKMMKGFIGSADVCAGGVAAPFADRLVYSLGEDVAPATGDDLDWAELIVVVGEHVEESLPIVWQRIMTAREENDAKVVVIGTSKPEQESAIDLSLTIRPGMGEVLMTGLLAFSRRAGIVDRAFLDAHVVVPGGFWDALEEGHDLWSTARACDLAPADLQAFYDLFAAHPRTVMLFDDPGLTAAIVNAHLATGRIGKPGAGPFPLVSACNAMGAREVGASPDVLAAHMDFTAEHIALTSRFWGAVNMVERGGKFSAKLGIVEGVKALWVVGDFLQPEDIEAVRAARASGVFVVYSGSRAIDGLADVSLPSPGWGERNGTMTGYDRMISRLRPLFPTPGEARPDWWAMTRVARAMGWRDAFYFDHPADVYREHARLSAYRNEGARLFDIRRHAAISNPAYDEMTSWRWGGAPFTGGRFQTPDGKARLTPAR